MTAKEKNLEKIFIFLLMFLSPGLSFVYLTIKIALNSSFEYYMYFSVLVGFNGYRWNPVGDTFDIVRHQKTFEMLRDNGNNYFLSRLLISESPLQIIFTKILSYWEDPRILNAIIPFVGMLMLTYIIYVGTSTLNKKFRIFYTLIVIASFRVLQFTSGLWNYFSIIMFSFAYLFLDSKNKYLIYLVSVLTHFSMIYPILIMLVNEVLFKLLENDEKIIFRKSYYYLIFSLSIMFFAFVSPLMISRLLNSFSVVFHELSFIQVLNTRFNSYFVNQDSHAYLMNYRYIFLELSKLILVWMFLCLNYFLNEGKKSKHFYYITLLSSITIGLGLRVRILLRFSILPLLLISTDLKQIEIDFKQTKSIRKIILIGIILFVIVQYIYQLYSMRNAFLI